MRGSRICLIAAAALGWSAVVSACGSSGDDLFEGTATGGGGGAKDASVDSSGGASGQGGKGGGLTGQGGSGAKSGAGGTAGKGGKGGQSGAGGKGNNGGSGFGGGGTGGGLGGSSGLGGVGGGVGGTGGAAGTGGSNLGGSGPGGSGGVGGSSGTGGAGDCAGPCDTSYCAGGTPSSDCQNCFDTVCKFATDRWGAAPSISQYNSCVSACSDNACWTNCCLQYPQTCWAGVLWQGCSCGYTNEDCKSECSLACSGGGIDDTCRLCVVRSPCTALLYDYYYHSDLDDFSSCRNNCAGEASCIADCCSSYPQACALRKAAVECICQ